MKQDIEIVRGTTNSFGITPVDEESGNALTLETGQVLVFAMKKQPKDAERVLVKKITHTVNGEYYLEFSPADTADLEPGVYYYDIGLQHGANVFYNVIKCRKMKLIANISELGDGA